MFGIMGTYTMGVRRMTEPVTFEAFREKFGSVQACVEALFQARWPDGYRCPICRHSRYYLTRTRRLPLYECKACRHQTSIIAGTVIEGSSTSLTKWFQAMFLLAQPSGISSLRLSEILEVTYKTAWLLSHKIRVAMRSAEQSELLADAVRMESFGYGTNNFLNAHQPLMLGGSFNDAGDLQGIKMQQPDPDHVRMPERTINKEGYQAFRSNQVRSESVDSFPFYAKAHPKLSPYRRQLKLWLNDTFGGIGAKHLQAYLNEFCFRANAMLGKSGAAIFHSLLSWCATTSRCTYSILTCPRRTLPVAWRVFGSKAKWLKWHRRAWSY